MTDYLSQLHGQRYPTALFGDLSSAKDFTWDVDPQTVAGVVLAVGDVWHPLIGTTPPPPSKYVPRVVASYGGSYWATVSDANTGITTDVSALTKYNYPGTTQITCTTDNQVFTSLDIYGDIVIKAKNVKFQNCILRGPRNWPSNDGAIIDCTSSSCINCVVQDSTFAPQLPNYYRDAMIGQEYTALRNRVFWCNDSFGIYSKLGPNGNPLTGQTQPTNARLYGNYCTDEVYWHGTSNALPSWPGQKPGPFDVTTTWGTTIKGVPGYPLKVDGTHNDGVQIQGGNGPSGSIHVQGNRFDHYMAEPQFGHPLGWTDPIPMLGTQDNQKMYVYNSSTPLPRMANGRYASNGAPVICQQNTYAFPLQDTVIVEDNFLNSGGIDANLHTNDGGHVGMKMVFQNNHFGKSIYNYSGSTTNPSVYPIRIDKESTAHFAGLANNYWAEVPSWAGLIPGGIHIGDPLIVYSTSSTNPELAPGNRGQGGIIYDSL